MAWFLFLALQIISIPQFPDPDDPVTVGGEIVGPYILREDAGQTTRVVLKNGLTVLVRENNAISLTSITTYVRVGDFDEPDSIVGVSRLLEHMFYKSTGMRSEGQVARDTEILGGALSSYSGNDRTVYQVVVPAENAVEALEIQADALLNPSWTAEQMDREIDIIALENLRDIDSPPAVTVDRLYSTAFVRHRMGRARLGSVDGLRALTPDELESFRNNYYSPSNTILAVVGRLDREQILADIVRLYGDEPDRPVSYDRGPAEPPQSRFRYSWERSSNSHTHVGLGFHVPDTLSSDPFVWDLLSAILSEGRASRMNRFMRDELGLIHSATTSFVRLDGIGFLQLMMETSRPIDAQVAVLEEIERIRRFGVSEEELARARVLLAQQHYQRLETVASIGHELAKQEALGDWKRMDRYILGIHAIDREDVQLAAERYLTASNLAVFEYLPASITRSFSDEDFEGNVLERVPGEFVPRSVSEIPVSAAIAPVDDEVFVDLVRPPIRRQVLRGPEVYVIEDHRLPLVWFGIFYPGGRLYESAENAGITELMLRSALRGTQRYNSADIARRFENAGARIEVVNEPDFFGYLVGGVSGQIDEALDVLMQVLQQPTFAVQEVAHERLLQQARIRGLAEDSRRLSVQLFMETAFDSHAYGRSHLGAEPSVRGLSREDLEEWHRQHQRTLVPLIVIVGDTNGTALVAPIAETLTNEDLSERDISRLPVPIVSLEREERIENWGLRHGALVYGGIASRMADRDRLALVLIRTALSGPGGRLTESIRDEQALGDGLDVADKFMSRSGAMFVSGGFRFEDEQRLLASLDEELERLVRHGITDDELERAVSHAVGSHDMSLETRRDRTLTYARAVISSGDVSTVTDFQENVRTVSKDTVRAVAEKYLSPSLAKIVIFRRQE